MNSVFYDAFLYLAAAVVAVPIAKRLGLGSVLGYLLAGLVIGPFGLGLVGEEGEDIMHFAEFGVVMMLFVVGLELEPALLWRMRVPILGLGGAQVVLTAAAGAVIAKVAGLTWFEGAAVGMTLALSSTAIVLQTLAEKGLMKSGAGQSAFAVLLFQDIAVIPMLALFPLLATHHAAHDDHGHGASPVAGLPGWLQTLAVLGAVAAIVLLGRTLLRPAFRFIAATRLRELFVAAALLLVIGIALLMTAVGLSPALGTFIAGVVLANSEYRHELESDIDPFKGLLLGLFFIAVGASIDFGVLAAQPGTIVGLTVVLIVVKMGLLLALGRLFGLGLDQNLLFAFALAQGGEFAFVLFSFATQTGVLTPSQTSPLVVVVALSMALTPLLLLAFEKGLQPRIGTLEKAKRPFDSVEDKHDVIVAGFGRFGQICTRLLDMQGIGYTVLEYDSDQVELLRKFGRKVYYGDATRPDLLAAAGAEEAKLLIITVDRPEKTEELVRTARQHFPHMQILARARGRVHAYELLDQGVEHVYRETFESALRMGTQALRLLGQRAHRAHRAAQRFRKYDEQLLRELAGRQQEEGFVLEVRRRVAELNEVLQQDTVDDWHAADAGWDNESLRVDGDVGAQEEDEGLSA